MVGSLLIKHFIKRVFDFLERLKGVRNVSFEKSYEYEDSHYKIVLNHGAVIKIHCVEYLYKIQYKRYFRIKYFSVFHVYCTCSDNVPDYLKHILKEDLRIPNVLSSLNTRENQKKAAIEAYVDLIINKNIKNLMHI